MDIRSNLYRGRGYMNGCEADLIVSCESDCTEQIKNNLKFWVPTPCLLRLHKDLRFAFLTT